MVSALTRSVALATVQVVPTHCALAGPAASSNSIPRRRAIAPCPHRVPMQPETPKIPLDISPPSLVDRASDGPLAHRLAGMLPSILGAV